jgi:hypothetical protein
LAKFDPMRSMAAPHVTGRIVWRCPHDPALAEMLTRI